MSARIFVVMGVSGCGKSTVGQQLASALKVNFLEGDQLHSTGNVARMAAGIALTDDDRQDWLDALANRIRDARMHGYGLIVSCSALKRVYRDTLRQGAADLHFVHLQGSPELLATRMSSRPGHYMPLSLLESQLAILEAPGSDENALTFDIALPATTIIAAITATALTWQERFNPMMTPELFRLDKRLALITGSSGGIGFALARGLGQYGATVILNGRNPDKLAAAAAALRAEGLNVHTRTFDAADAQAVQMAIDDIEAHIGAIDILVNNAGMQRRAPLEDFTTEHWHELIRTNVDSVFLVGQAVARKMIPRKRGKIINICSVQSELGRPNIAPYTASKGAVKMLTKGMAIDWGPHGIQVNGLGPGYFKTELNAKLVADEQFSTWLTGRTPSRRWGNVEELAGAAVFLASDASSFVNGHILYVDGGVTATL